MSMDSHELGILRNNNNRFMPQARHMRYLFLNVLRTTVSEGDHGDISDNGICVDLTSVQVSR
jgi:hypothetical protein